MAGLQLFLVMSCFIGLPAVAGTIEYSDIENAAVDVSAEDLEPELVKEVNEYMRLPLD